MPLPPITFVFGTNEVDDAGRLFGALEFYDHPWNPLNRGGPYRMSRLTFRNNHPLGSASSVWSGVMGKAYSSDGSYPGGAFDGTQEITARVTTWSAPEVSVRVGVCNVDFSQTAYTEGGGDQVVTWSGIAPWAPQQQPAYPFVAFSGNMPELEWGDWYATGPEWLPPPPPPPPPTQQKMPPGVVKPGDQSLAALRLSRRVVGMHGGALVISSPAAPAPGSAAPSITHVAGQTIGALRL